MSAACQIEHKYSSDVDMRHSIQIQETAMKAQLSAACLLIAVGKGVSFAQDVVIAPEQQTVIREYVVKQKVAPVELPADVQITAGSTLPDTVELHAVEVPDMQTKYSYVVVGGETVLVDPGTRKIVHVMK